MLAPGLIQPASRLLRGDGGVDVISDVIKNAVSDKDGHLTKAFQKENMTLQVNC